MLKLLFSFPCILSHTFSDTFSLSLSLFLSISFSLSLSVFLSLSLSHSLFMSPSPSVSLSLSHTHTHTLYLSLSLTPSLSEFGQRALGSRSIIADPRKVELRRLINEKIKEREWFVKNSINFVAFRIVLFNTILYCITLYYDTLTHSCIKLNHVILHDDIILYYII